MKFKTRIQVLLVICIFPIVVLLIYFNRFQKEIQDPGSLVQKNGLYRKDLFYPSSTNSAAILQTNILRRNVPISHKKRNFRVAAMVGLQINAKLQEMNFTTNPSHKEVVINSLKDLQSDVKSYILKDVNLNLLWRIAEKWVSSDEIYPENPIGLGNVLKAMSTFKITKAEVPSKGSQLKLLLTLDGNQTVIFKPMRLSRSHIILENPYAGPDRHNGEIVAFHLNRLLGFRKVPISVGRKINLAKEVSPVASEKLLKTFTYHGNEGQTCFYGVCYYCRPSDQVCTDSAGLMEGAVILWLPNRQRFTLKKLRNPWRRSYKKNVTARWESEVHYCQRVLKASPFVKYENLILELIDVSIFDYLIGNADRHTLELFVYNKSASLIFIDNGKSLGNPFWDELTILAPLYQCCRIYRQTYSQLLLFVDSLASSLDQITKFDPLYPLLTSSHSEALDRRLRIVLATIELCTQKDGESNVLI